MNVTVSKQNLSEAYGTANLEVRQNGELLAALTLYDNPHVSFKGLPTLLFGQLQLPANNQEAVTLLFGQAEAEAKSGSKRVLLGPMNGSSWQSYRLPLDGDRPAFYGDLTMPAYWATGLQQAGFRIAESYHTSIATLTERQVEIPAGVTIQPISEASILQDLPGLHGLCMEAFAGAPCFSPLDEGDFVSQYSKAAPMLAAGLSYTARRDGQIIAFVFAYPDKEHNAIVIKTIARHPTVWVPVLMQTLLNIVCNNAFQQGYKHAIHAFMHDQNRSVEHSSRFGGKLLRRYALFAKTVCA
jgi:hypothetical protein